MYHGPGGTSYSTYYGKYYIQRDSLIDGQIFYKANEEFLSLFRGENESDYFFRYDSSFNKLFVKLPGDDTVRLAVDFNVPTDSVFVSYLQGEPRTFTSRGFKADTIFGYPVQTFKVEFDFSGDDGYYIFADGFGIIEAYDFGWSGSTDYGSAHNYLISAVVDSAVYNPIILEITNLYPLIDRPIDTFPFVLYISGNSTIPYLIDSLYVDIILTRSDTTLNSWRLNFTYQQVNVPILSSMLEVGDKIKFRATATDESIFNNVAHFPDSGYAIINVLDATTGVQDDNNQPYEFSLSQNYPNPFNPSTKIKFEIPGKTRNDNILVTLKIYDVLGNEVATLVNSEKPPGNYEVTFNAGKYNLPSGVYFYRLKAGNFIESKKMILLR